MTTKHSAKLLQYMGTDLTPVQAARLSFDVSTSELDAKGTKLIQYLAKHKHMSPFEHTAATFEIVCTMPIAAQIMRHRTFSYSQVSRRFTSKGMDVYLPDVWRKQGDPVTGNKQSSHGEVADTGIDRRVMESVCSAVSCYNDLIDAGVCREQARWVLPQGTLTKFWMTGNLRNFAHFLGLRLNEDAQYEVQVIAEDIFRGLNDQFPHSIQALLVP